MRTFLVFCLVLNAAVINAQDWEEPPLLDPGSENVEFSPESIIMDEENTGEVIIAVINYKGDTKPTVNFLIPPNGNEVTGLLVRKNDVTSYWELVVTQRQDYESGVVRFDMQIVLNSKQHVFSLHIRNIDDNTPVVIAEQSECKIEEDTLDDDSVNCFYKVRDEDGNLGDITWTINGESEQNIFKFEPVDKPPYPESQKEMRLKLGLKQKLDFKVTSMHIIDFEVMDTQASANLRIVVKVIDIPNQLPGWYSISHSEQFNEKTSQEFTVEARDGDTDINDIIGYSIYFPEEDWKHYISIDSESGKITVKPIDRDAEEREIYKFTVKACEMTFTPNACIEQGVTFIINDVNDNAPTFTLDPVEGNVLKIEENRMSTIETKITVRDIDMGDNARYTLRLTGEGHEEAFSVAPTSGYQQSVVDLFIVNFGLLDYENPIWKEFTFQLEAVEATPSQIVHEPVTFTIELINRNDEFPIFQACNNEPETLADDCVVKIEETFPGDTYLVTMVAHDADIDGSVEHTLLGAYANRILRIDAETGEIFTQNLLRPFNYETLSEVIVQVQAKDSLPGDLTQNIVLGQLTIKLMDVNDETPIIYVETTTDSVEENRPDGYDIGIEIIATDEDSMADLEVSIDWEASDGIKNGRRITSMSNFQPYKGCVVLDIDEDSRTGKYVKAKLRFNEAVEGNTPDFEIFDTLDLLIVAVDRDQPEGDIPNRASIKVQVYITNLNDNKPKFTESINIERRVNENTCPDALIGIINAEDLDADADLTYSLEPRNGTDPGLVKIGPKSGELLVDGSDKCDSIDADKPIWYLYYTVTVTDGEHTTSAEIEIYVVDMNDINPRFDRADESPPIVIPIDEHWPDGDDVETFTATDGDRDEENNKVTYSISTTTSVELRSYFKIDELTGRVYVSYADPNQELDRDNGIPTPPITIVIDAKDSGARSGSLTFTVELLDKNNNAPVLKTESLSIGEESSKDDVLSPPVTATDADESGNPNSFVTFEIISIEATSNNQEGDLELFVLKDANEVAGTVNLVAGKNLKGYFDDYKVTVAMSDQGTPPQTSEGSFVVTINRYNFEDPKFIFPTSEDIQKGIYLSKSQVIGMPILKLSGDPLDNLSADDQQNNKFPINFSVEDKTNVITLTPSGEYLTVTKDDGFVTNVPFDVTITATSAGRPSRSTTITVKMTFIDENFTPLFTTNDFTTTNFQEEAINQEFAFPEAKYETGDLNLDLKLYYLVETKDSPFTIKNNQVPMLFLEGPLDREEQAEYTVVIQASNRESGSIEPDPSAQLTIQIMLKDVNDNAPKFEAETYYTIFHYDDKGNFVVTTLTAYDLDVDDTLTYTITDRNLDHATSFPTFDVDSVANTGEVKLTEDASSSAAGYAVLTITVQDGDPEHDARANLEVYVVSEEKHIVRFKFNNDVTEVEVQKEAMITILMDTFKSDNGVPYDPIIRRSTVNTEDEEETPGAVTEIYFIDTENHKPLEKRAIEMLANDINTYVRLEQQFLGIGLNLVSFSTISPEPDNTVEVLRAWLIGVAVVLGCLCVLLIVAFVLKTRSLTKRLNKLSVTKYGSQESGLNRKVVPNTNRHALEGSNPVFSIEKKPQEFDQASIGSGDSDLIGVENNPDFQRKPQANGTQKY